MDTLQVNPEPGSSITNYYVWEVPGKNVVIHLDYDVVDSLLIEVMRGFGAMPRRGGEVGGIFLGRGETGEEKTSARVGGAEGIAWERRRGPSYLLSEGDIARHEEALKRHRLNTE